VFIYTDNKCVCLYLVVLILHPIDVVWMALGTDHLRLQKTMIYKCIATLGPQDA